MKLYQKISRELQSMVTDNPHLYDLHHEAIKFLCEEYMPSGSGFDCGTTFDFGESTPERLVFISSFHHMNDGGYYDGWSELKIVVTPSLAFGFSCCITGILRKYRYDADFFCDTFAYVLDQEIPQ